MERFVYDYAAVIGIDGMGNFNRFANTPNLDSFFEDGAVNDFALSMNPTISAENWAAMLLGASPIVHGLTNSALGRFEHTNAALPSIFKRIREKYPDATLTSVCNWNPINTGAIETTVGVDKETARSDEELTPIILEKIAKKPKMLFVQFDNVDGAGHSSGYGSESHIKQIEKTDEYLGRIFEAYKAAGIADSTLFIVIADHGGIRRGHGGYTDEEKFVYFGVKGKSVMKGSVACSKTVDVAAVVLYALGIDVPDYDEGGFSSQIPEGIFAGATPKYQRRTAAESVVENLPTPCFGGENGLSALPCVEKLKLAAFFDNEIKDETGKCSFEESGTIKYYSNGVRGACGEFGLTGSAKTSDITIGKNSFSLAVWLKIEPSINEECVVCSTKPWWWQKRSSKGFSLVVKKSDTVLCIANGNDDLSLITPFPEDFAAGWINALFTVDKQKKEIGVWYDFRFIRSFPMDEAFCGETVANVFSIGNDTENDNNNRAFPNIFRMDDLLLFDGVLSAEDIASLGDYYGKVR